MGPEHLSQEKARLGVADRIPGRLGGWEILPRAAIGPAPAGPLRVDFALLHPRRGVALVDLAPRSTPKAVETLRRSLRAALSPGTPPGHLPIVYCCLAPWELRDLVALLDAGFARERPLTLPAGGAWMGAVERLMRAEDGPDGPAPAAIAASGEPAGSRRSWASAGLLAVAATLLLGAGLVAARLDGLPLPPLPPLPEAVALAPRGTPPGMAGAAAAAGGGFGPPAQPVPDEAPPPAALAEPAWGEDDPALATPAPPATAEPPDAPAPQATPLQAAALPPEGPEDTAEPPAWGPPPTDAAVPQPASTAEMAGTEAAPTPAEEPHTPPPPATAAPGPVPAPATSAATAFAAQLPATTAGAAARTARRPRPAAAEPPAATAAPSPALDRQCLALLARAQLGEEPSLADRSRLRTACAPRHP